MDAREQRGMQIAATTRLRSKGGVWFVPSQSSRTETYRVSEAVPRNLGMECTCPDYGLRGRPCKHIIAVEIVRKREAPDGTVVTETMRVTYGQDWSAYTAAQCSEKERFLPMLKDLCATVQNPPQGRGRPRMPMSDMIFASVFKVYEGLSGRRFDSDVREAQAKGLTDSDAHFTTILRHLRSPEMTPVLKGLVELSALPLKAVEVDFAVDATGFTTGRFERWYDHKWGKERSRHEWVKLHAMTGVVTNIVTAVELSDGHRHDSPYFRPLLETTTQNFTPRDVTADKAYSSRANLQAVVDSGATPLIPFRGVPAFTGAVPELMPHASAFLKMQYFFAYQRDTFLSRYHVRSNVESTFSMIKRKFGDSLRSKSEVGQMNEILCKVIAHNLCVLIASMHEIGLEMPKFSGGEIARLPA